MTQRIHQLQVAYAPGEDRLLLRVNTQRREEFRFWLTRRFIKRFWPGLRKSLEKRPGFDVSNDPAARTAMMQFMHDHAVSQADFNTEYQAQTGETTPLGTAPVLVTRARIQPKGLQTHLLSFHPENGPGIEVAMDPHLLHSFCKLLADAVSQADWDMLLNLKAGAAAPLGSLPPERQLH